MRLTILSFTTRSPTHVISLQQDPAQKTFQGDNFVRRAGDFDAWQALNLHAVAAQNRGQDIAMMVRPWRP